jgi:hypothetical protein
MKACQCGTSSGPWDNTRVGQEPVQGKRRSDFLSRFLSFVGWIVPTAILALIPKCPACVAGYAVIGTSVGLSLSASTQLRLAVIVLCVVSLSYLWTKSVLFVVARIASKKHP